MPATLSHSKTLVSGVRGVFVVASGLPSSVTDERQLTPQNHWGSVSSASPSTYAGLDPVCARTTPARTESGRYLCLFVCQATDGHGEMMVHLVLANIQQASPEVLIVSRCLKARCVEYAFWTTMSAGFLCLWDENTCVTHACRKHT